MTLLAKQPTWAVIQRKADVLNERYYGRQCLGSTACDGYAAMRS